MKKISFLHMAFFLASMLTLGMNNAIFSQPVSSQLSAKYVGKFRPLKSNAAFKPILLHDKPVDAVQKKEKDTTLLLLKEQAMKRKLERMKRIELQKDLNPKETEDGSFIENRASSATIGANFQGNDPTSYPNDNSIAISNGGRIVSVVNSNIAVYNQQGNLLDQWSLQNFFNLTKDHIGDPHVIYDSDRDRFIIIALDFNNGGRVHLAFSQTNNPSGYWHKYEIFVTLNKKDELFDYPYIALSSDHLIITGNMFWSERGFESVVVSINKNQGYSGKQPTWWYWRNITPNIGTSTLFPVRNGMNGTYGNAMYFASTSWQGSDYINIHYFVPSLSSAGNFYSPTKVYSLSPYALASSAVQKGSTVDVLDSGDCRIKGGYYQNGILHLVFTTDTDGLSGIRYCRINASTQKVIFETTTAYTGIKDYAYPSIAPLTTNANDQSAYMIFLATGTNAYAEIRGKFFDHNGNTTASTLIKAGENTIKLYPESLQRWGDYSGIARKHNDASIWIAGSYAKRDNKYGTHIAQIRPVQNYSAEAEARTNPANIDDANMVRVYPNPTADYISLEFTIDAVQKMNFDVISTTGQKKNLMTNAICASGQNRFYFTTESLANGVYFLVISKDGKIFKSEKFVVSK